MPKVHIGNEVVDIVGFNPIRKRIFIENVGNTPVYFTKQHKCTIKDPSVCEYDFVLFPVDNGNGNSNSNRNSNNGNGNGNGNGNNSNCNCNIQPTSIEINTIGSIKAISCQESEIVYFETEIIGG